MSEYDAEETPHKFGKCEYCLRHTTVYAFALWVCADCLKSDPNAK